MENIEKIKIRKDVSIRNAMQAIDAGKINIAIVVDENNKLIGTVSDGDVRRALLKGFELSSPITPIICYNPTCGHIDDSNEKILKIALSTKLRQIPIIDSQGILCDIKTYESILTAQTKPNAVVIMAGGKGNRLKDLTKDIPKPMLKVGRKPMLETIIETFFRYGYKNIILSVNYKSQIIKDHFADGSKFGVDITYVDEGKQLGTAGSLSLIDKQTLQYPFFVMNGDILTDIDLNEVLAHHNSKACIATMCVREYDYAIPYGVITLDDDKNITEIVEKPVHKFFVNAGIYVLNPLCLDFIPREHFDMPALFDLLKKQGLKTCAFPIRGYWLDIGQIQDYKRANFEYENFFDIPK